MEPGTLRVITDLDFGVGQLTQFFDGLHICSPHIGSCDDAQLASTLRELAQLVHNKPQTTPFDEGHQHVNAVSRHDFLFQLGIHLRLMNGTGEQRALRNRGLRSFQLFCAFSCGKARVVVS